MTTTNQLCGAVKVIADSVLENVVSLLSLQEEFAREVGEPRDCQVSLKFTSNGFHYTLEDGANDETGLKITVGEDGESFAIYITMEGTP